MAEEVQIAGSSERGKIREPLGVIGLGIITLGIYSIVWYYKINKEMAEIGQAKGTDECGTNPTNSLLALVPGALACGIPTLISYFNATKRLQATERVAGAPPGMEPGLLFILLLLIGPVGQYIFQSNLNKALQAQAGGAGAIPAAPQQPQQAPAQEQPQPRDTPPDRPAGS